MAVALRGNLSDFGIGEVFQLIGQQRKTGVLVVDGEESERIHVSFVDGAVVSASTVGQYEEAALGEMLVRAGVLAQDRLLAIEGRIDAEDESFRRLAVQEEGLAARDVDAVEDLVTRETLFKLLRWSAGSFHFSAQKVRTRNPDATGQPAEQILMDGLRMVDEWRTFDPDACRDEAIFRAVDSFDTYRESVRGETQRQRVDAQRLFELIDGKRSVRRAIDLSRLGSFEGARILTAMRRAGTIEPLASAEPAAPARAPRAAAVRAAYSWVAAFGAALPFVLLLLVAAFAQRAPSVPAESGLGDPLAAARAAGAALRMRNAAEAYRFAHGRDPANLDELAADGWRDDPAMAGAPASPYPLPIGGGELVLLAPEN